MSSSWQISSVKHPRPTLSFLSIANLLRYGSVTFVVLSTLLTSSVLIRLSARMQLQEHQELQQVRSSSVAKSIETYLDELQTELLKFDAKLKDIHMVSLHLWVNISMEPNESQI